MKQQIEKTIRELECEKGISILFACESGSRAWGFASPDSDYDLRFIYAHPLDWHLKLEKQADSIDLMLPNELDLAGWELAKTLRLFASCNLGLNEWLDSPVVYWNPNGFYQELSQLIPAYFNPKKAMHHYLSIAKGTASDHFDGRKIKIKKLFYILRPLFACLWIEKNLSMPPTYFQTMLDAKLAEAEILQAIEAVQKTKETAAEGFVIETPEPLFAWIDSTLERSYHAAKNLPTGSKTNWDPLNELLCKWTPSVD